MTYFTSSSTTKSFILFSVAEIWKLSYSSTKHGKVGDIKRYRYRSSCTLVSYTDLYMIIESYLHRMIEFRVLPNPVTHRRISYECAHHARLLSVITSHILLALTYSHHIAIRIFTSRFAPSVLSRLSSNLRQSISVLVPEELTVIWLYLRLLVGDLIENPIIKDQETAWQRWLT